MLYLAADLAAIITNSPRIAILSCVFLILRLLNLWRYLSVAFRSLAALSPLFWQVVPPLAAVYFSFAWIGVQLFGGKLYRGNPKLIGTDYDLNDYYGFNWNDVSSGLVTQFIMLVGNNAFIITKGCTAIGGESVRTFFYAFWLLAVLVMLNLFFALVFRVVDIARDEQGQADSDETTSEDGSAGDRFQSLGGLDPGKRTLYIERTEMID